MAATMTRTFLFTDIEGSSRLWEDLPDAMKEDVGLHDRLVRERIAQHGGQLVKSTGDGVHATFEDATRAVAAALDAQRAFLAAQWRVPGGIHVRMGIHTGEAEARDGDWFGSAVNRAARVMSLAHGGQTLVSEATALPVRGALPPGSSVRDLGVHVLRNLSEPERIFQADADGLPSTFAPIGAPAVKALPHVVTSFVGREVELETLPPLVLSGRLVTLLGPGGSGKTRLALRVAAEVAAAFPDGVAFVDLAPLSDPSLVAAATAQAAGVREVAGTPIVETVVERLRDARMLVILDNCEHLVGACATVADTLLRSCRSLHVVTTSREALGVPGEVTFPVPPFGLPDSAVPDSVARSEAGQLFIARASAVVPGFSVDAENVAAIAEICRRLDGIPLAIELAAARVRVLSPNDIARRLDDRFALLTGGGRTLLPRQQTLRALIDWSHQLLDTAERTVYRRLAVFPGDFDLESVEVVCGPNALEPLFQLVGRSLVGRNDRGTETRFRMLDSIRAHAHEELRAAGEEVAVRDAHLAWCLALCRSAEPELIGKEQRRWFDRIAGEHHHLRAALAWGLEQHPRDALALAKMAFWFWQARGHQSEGRTWTDAALAHPAARARDGLRQGALVASGSLAWTSGDWAAADRALGEAAAIAAELEDPRGQVVALCLQGQSRVFAEDYPGARAVLDQAIALARGIGEPYPLARSLGSMADLARCEGRDEELVLLADEARKVFETIGMNEGIAFNLVYGAWALRSSDPTDARARIEDALERFHGIDHPYGFAFGLMAWLQVVEPDPMVAARMLGAIDAHSVRSSMQHSAHDRRLLAAKTDAVRREMGEGSYVVAFEEGALMPSARVLELARGTTRR